MWPPGSGQGQIEPQARIEMNLFVITSLALVQINALVPNTAGKSPYFFQDRLAPPFLFTCDKPLNQYHTVYIIQINSSKIGTPTLISYPDLAATAFARSAGIELT